MSVGSLQITPCDCIDVTADTELLARITVRSDVFGDKLAYTPEDITASWDQPVQVWRQFCEEVLIVHDGMLSHPVWQEELLP